MGPAPRPLRGDGTSRFSWGGTYAFVCERQWNPHALGWMSPGSGCFPKLQMGLPVHQWVPWGAAEEESRGGFSGADGRASMGYHPEDSGRPHSSCTWRNGALTVNRCAAPESASSAPQPATPSWARLARPLWAEARSGFTADRCSSVVQPHSLLTLQTQAPPCSAHPPTAPPAPCTGVCSPRFRPEAHG